MKKFVLIILTTHFIFLFATLVGLGCAIATVGEKYAFWVVMTICYCFSYLVFNIVFSKYTNRFPKNSICETLFPKSDLKKDLFITVSRKGEIYYIETDKKEIALDLTQYPFKTAYVLAFLSRNLRYSAVSDKLPLKGLFARKLRISDTSFNCSVLFVTENRTKERKLVRGGVSSVTFFQNLMNKSRYYTYFFSGYSQSQFINKRVCRINEEIYQAGHIITPK